MATIASPQITRRLRHLYDLTLEEGDLKLPVLDEGSSSEPWSTAYAIAALLECEQQRRRQLRRARGHAVFALLALLGTIVDALDLSWMCGDLLQAVPVAGSAFEVLWIALTSYGVLLELSAAWTCLARRWQCGLYATRIAVKATAAWPSCSFSEIVHALPRVTLAPATEMSGAPYGWEQVLRTHAAQRAIPGRR